MCYHNKNIVLLTLWLGDWPWYFTYFLHSCKYNASIDFCIYTDNEISADVPDNVKFVRYSLDEFNQDATEALKTKWNMKNKSVRRNNNLDENFKPIN